MSQLWSPPARPVPEAQLWSPSTRPVRRASSASSQEPLSPLSPLSPVTLVPRTRNPGRRFAQIIRLKPEFIARYKQIHAAVWPEVLKQIKDCNIRDYSIFHDPGTGILFASFKYVGYDYAGDMEKMRENPKMREWWKMTDSFQESLVPGAKDSESGEPSWWKPIEEVFYAA